jgi:hypothetical protein
MCTFAVVLFGLVGISSAQSSSPSATTGATSTAGDSDTLRERAANFWAARIAGDVNTQWQLLEPRGKARMTPLEYAGSPGAVKYLAYQVEDATVNGYFGTVAVRLLIQPLLPGASSSRVAPAGTVVKDQWIRLKGMWYRTLEQE